jgi:transcriptional regulator with XRE-family HTH domain
MQDPNLPFCTECHSGNLTSKAVPGRTFLYRKGVELQLPDTFEVPTCDKCGAEIYSEELHRAAEAEVRPEFVKQQRHHIGLLLDTIKTEQRCTLRQIEDACGVTPTYLSHVASGRKEASDLLIGQLEAFALYSEELPRRLARTAAFDTAGLRSRLGERKGFVVWRTSLANMEVTGHVVTPATVADQQIFLSYVAVNDQDDFTDDDDFVNGDLCALVTARDARERREGVYSWQARTTKTSKGH